MPRDLFVLAQQSHAEAGKMAQLLESTLALESLALSAEGFVVPSPEALANAAKVFAAVQAMPGENAALGAQAHTPEQRLDLICALATSLQGLQDALELSWSSAWSVAGKTYGSPVRLQALQVLAEWNAGHAARLLQEMAAAVQMHEQDEIWRR